MATRFSNALINSAIDDATFRASAQFVHDLFVTTGGWVNTADTGQIDLATVVRPGVINTKAGYKIYRMDDALQATSPVYIKFEFGTGAGGSPNFTPAFWISIGTGSDGAGNLTNVRLAAVQITHGGALSATATNSYGSATNARIHFGLFIRAVTSILMLSLERSKNAAGADTGDGIIIILNTATTINYMRYVILGSAAQPAAETGLPYALSLSNPSAFDGNVAIGIPIPMKGAPQQPGIGIGVVRANDFAAESAVTVTMYGNVITYQHLHTITPSQVPVNTSDTASRILMRYD